MTAAADELYSLLVPLTQERLILPRTCVAEVVRYTAPDPVGTAPEWLLGQVRWSGRQVPVLSFEGLAGLQRGEPGGRTRIAVINAISGRLNGGFFGILTEGFPQLVRVNRDVIQLESRQRWPAGGPVLCQIRMINEYPLIPDLETIEDLLVSALTEPLPALS
jgi:chemosensory pili system protein ChpC